MPRSKKEQISHASDLLDTARRLGANFSSQAIYFHEAVAAKLSLNPTDSKCLGLIRNAQSQVTAGWIAEATGLTTGAVTGVLDRLEKTGLIQRLRDQQDRRKVYVQLDPNSQARFEPLYQGLNDAVSELLLSYSEAELETIADFMTRSTAMLQEQSDRLRQASP